MANKPIIMNKIKQIILLHCQGQGSRKISTISGVSRNVVRQYIARFGALKVSFTDIEDKSNEELSVLFCLTPTNTLPDSERYTQLHDQLPAFSKELSKKGVTLDSVHRNYLMKYPQGYCRSQFYKYIMQYRRRRGLSMHIDHKAGESMYVDYCGDKLNVIMIDTGELVEYEVFIAILGYSQLTYIEAVSSQTKNDFIGCCRNAIEYFGGATETIVPDNLKAAVTKSSKYEPILNETFAAFAEHYGTVILPARPYKPKDKPLVENAVKLAYQRVYTEVDNKPYLDLQSVNNSIRTSQESHNNAPLKKSDSRREIFEAEEKQTLVPLPQIRYELQTIKICTVMKNCHVGLHADRHYYSVPSEYVGKKVKLIYDSLKVDIYFKFKQIATHKRNYRKNKYTTLKEHLAPQHGFILEWTPEFFINRGKEVSEELAVFLDRLMAGKDHPQQGYKACLGVLNLAKRVGPERITKACKRAISFGSYHYSILEDILKKNLDQINDEDDSVVDKNTPLHQNLRGKEYYNQKLINLNE